MPFVFCSVTFLTGPLADDLDLLFEAEADPMGLPPRLLEALLAPLAGPDLTFVDAIFVY